MLTTKIRALQKWESIQTEGFMLFSDINIYQLTQKDVSLLCKQGIYSEKKEKDGENGCISEARLGCRREAELIMVRAVVKENEVSSRAISLFPAQPPTE